MHSSEECKTENSTVSAKYDQLRAKCCSGLLRLAVDKNSGEGPSPAEGPSSGAPALTWSNLPRMQAERDQPPDEIPD